MSQGFCVFKAAKAALFGLAAIVYSLVSASPRVQHRPPISTPLYEMDSDMADASSEFINYPHAYLVPYLNEAYSAAHKFSLI